LFTPAGALTMDNDQSPIVAVLKTKLTMPDKAALGGVIPFLHSYETTVGWWVTHHAEMLSNIRCGNAIISQPQMHTHTHIHTNQ
jgi:hypothetical protein